MIDLLNNQAQQNNLSNNIQIDKDQKFNLMINQINQINDTEISNKNSFTYKNSNIFGQIDLLDNENNIKDNLYKKDSTNIVNQKFFYEDSDSNKGDEVKIEEEPFQYKETFSNNSFGFENIKSNLLDPNSLNNKLTLLEHKPTLKSKMSNKSLSSTNDKFPNIVFKSGNLKKLSQNVDEIMTMKERKPTNKNIIKAKLSGNVDFKSLNKSTTLLVKETRMPNLPYETFTLEEQELDETSKIKSKNKLVLNNNGKLNENLKYTNNLESKQVNNNKHNILKSNSKNELRDIYKNFFDPKSMSYMYNKIITERDKLRKELNFDVNKYTKSISYTQAEKEYLKTLQESVFVHKGTGPNNTLKNFNQSYGIKLISNKNINNIQNNSLEVSDYRNFSCNTNDNYLNSSNSRIINNNFGVIKLFNGQQMENNFISEGLNQRKFALNKLNTHDSYVFNPNHLTVNYSNIQNTKSNIEIKDYNENNQQSKLLTPKETNNIEENIVGFDRNKNKKVSFKDIKINRNNNLYLKIENNLETNRKVRIQTTNDNVNRNEDMFKTISDKFIRDFNSKKGQTKTKNDATYILQHSSDPIRLSHLKPNYNNDNFNTINYNITDNINFRRHFSTIDNPYSFNINNKDNMNYSQSKNIMKLNKHKYFCPHCSHCCKIQDNNLNQYISHIKEAKNVINKYALYILQSNILDEKHQNLFADEIIKNISYEENTISKDFPLVMQSNDIKFNSKIVEEKLSQIPKVNLSNKNARIILSNILEALLENKESIENVLESEVKERFSKILIAKGEMFNVYQNSITVNSPFPEEKNSQINKHAQYQAKQQRQEQQTNSSRLGSFHLNSNHKFKKSILCSENLDDKQITSEVFFDDELFSMMDENTLNSIQELVKKKIFDNEEFKYDQNEMAKLKNESKERFLVLFVLFIQILAEVSIEDKSRAVLLYKFFKYYFIEQDKKWITIIKEMKSKVKYYKILSKIIIQQKNRHLKHIEEISEVLVANRLSIENLKKHKELIQDLLGVIQEKRDEIYLQNSEINTLRKELNFWVLDFDKLKINKEIRERMAGLNKAAILTQIDREIGHKNLKKETHSLVANSDIYLLLSGQRKYFFDQKEYYLNEISRVSSLNCKYSAQIDDLQQQLMERIEEIKNLKEKHSIELEELRKRIATSISSQDCQTDIDMKGVNQIIKNNDYFLDLKKLTEPKIMEVYDNIVYNCSVQKPISKVSLLKLIPEIYMYKFEGDLSVSNNNIIVIGNCLADYFYKFFKNKFQISRLAKEKMEATVLSIIKYSSNDTRVDLFRRILNLGKNPLSSFISERYFNILKSLSFHFNKLFEIDQDDPDIRDNLFQERQSNDFQKQSLQTLSPLKKEDINKKLKVKLQKTNKILNVNAMFQNNPLVKQPAIEFLITLDLALDILNLRVQIDHIIKICLEKFLQLSVLYSNKLLVKNSSELVLLKLKNSNSINNNNLAFPSKTKSESHFSFVKLEINQYDKSTMNNFFNAYLLELILNKSEIIRDLSVANEKISLFFEGPNSKYLKNVERVMEWFSLSFYDIMKILKKFFVVDENIRIPTITNSKRNINTDNNNHNSINSIKLLQTENSHTKTLLNEKIKNDWDEKSNREISLPKTISKDLPMEKSTRKNTSKYFFEDKVPEEFIVEVSKIKLSEFLNLKLGFKISANDFISMCLSSLENIEKIVNEQIENVLEKNYLNNEFSIQHSNIRGILTLMVPENQLRAVEEEILRNSKIISNRNFFTKDEFRKIVINSPYLVKIILESSIFYKKTIEKIKEFILNPV